MSDDYVVAPAALDDIDEIAAWMREQDPSAEADLRFIDAAYEAFALLADQPGIGHQRQDLTSLPVLFWTAMKGNVSLPIPKYWIAVCSPASGASGGCRISCTRRRAKKG